jgi:hypothetical protein
MISSEVQRTLVKSPPELWAEISDPESLARHLGEFGEIRITRLQPEQKVEWEASDASGAVVIKPSGWGTKVKLTVTRRLAEIAELEAGAELEANAELEADVEPEAVEPEAGVEPADATAGDNSQTGPGPAEEPANVLGDEPDLTNELQSAAEPAHDLPAAEKAGPEIAEAMVALEHERPDEPPSQPEPEPRRGFFARLFGRRARAGQPRHAAPSPVTPAEPEPELPGSELPAEQLDMIEHDFELETAAAAEHAPTAGEQLADDVPVEPNDALVGADLPPVAAEATEQTAQSQDNSSHDSSPAAVEQDDAAARAKLAEEIATEQVTAVLTGVLDRLGAAHHRPFSRA